MPIDDSVPYRLGTSKLPPLPMNLKDPGGPLPPKVQEAREIASEYLKGEPLSFLYMRNPNEERKTVLILSLYAPALKDKWHKAIEKLYECFKHEEGLDAQIADYNIFNPLFPKPITTAEVDLHQVVPLFDDHEWMTVDIVRWYSPLRQEVWPTVVITARDAGQDSWWSKNIPAVEKFLKEQGLDLEVVLLFLDKLLPQSSQISDRKHSPVIHSAPDLFPTVGNSVGIQNMDGSETVGCEVRVEDGRLFGVTACRNFRQRPESTQTGLIGLSIQSPSSCDNRLAKKRMSSDLKGEDLDLGKISSVSSSGSWLSDWCLFELRPEACILTYVDKWARIEDGKTYRVKKWGRSTGLTEGTISASPSIINSKYIEHAQDASTIAFARCIVPKDRPFCLPGDNGASVQRHTLDYIGGFVPHDVTLGLCVAYNEATKVSYMTPMATIVDEINDAVGGKIEKPQEIQLE